MNKIDHLDPEEKELIESYENDEWQSIDNIEEEKKRHVQFAKNTSRRCPLSIPHIKYIT